jgi:hypothetical protein
MGLTRVLEEGREGSVGETDRDFEGENEDGHSWALFIQQTYRLW